MQRRDEYDGWTGMPGRGALELAQEPSVPRSVALVLIANARAHKDGHAPFLESELRTLLARPDTATGELKPLLSQNVSRAIAAAKKAGWIADTSTARCIVLRDHMHHHGTGRRGPSLCHH